MAIKGSAVAGNDVVSIHYGRGKLDCGPGRDVYHVARTRKAGYKITNCEKVDYRPESQRGALSRSPDRSGLRPPADHIRR